MPILNRIQQRSLGGRLLLTAIYAILCVGAVTMVYPFLLMVSGSMKSELDMQHLDVVPRFLYDDAALFQRYEEQRYARLDVFNIATLYRDENGNKLFSFDQIPVPTNTNDPVIPLWEKFLEGKKDAPRYYYAVGHFSGSRIVAENQYRFQHAVQDKFPDTPRKDLSGMMPNEEWGSRTFQGMQGRFAGVYQEMRDTLADRYFYPISLRGYYHNYVLPQLYPPNAEGLKELNTAWGTNYETFSDVPLPATAPAAGPARDAWWTFTRDLVSARFIEIEPALHASYATFLQTKYGDIANYNKLHSTEFADFAAAVAAPAQKTSLSYSDIESFVKTLSSPDGLRLASAEISWGEFLKTEFGGDIARLQGALGPQYQTFEDVPMPTLLYDYIQLQRNKTAVRWEFATRNYRVAWDQVVTSGNGLRNTVIFCLLNILTALIINPLAAYALSRFQPSWGQQALFIMMATMAFPAEVTQIPSFLLLRDLGWLNTFAALVIPAAANGYSIFLLKGFFDSLPKELYEAANIDGCSEIRAFFTIALPLSKPILAVIALGAFTAAYGAFMFALLVCQDESMWTLMVYIYQLQQSYAQPIVFAALIIAALPTLLVFVFCQNIIMRGIVVPVEK